MTPTRISSTTHERGVRQAAAWLTARGVTDGDRVAISGVNHRGLLEAAHAALRLGADACIVAPYEGVDRTQAMVALLEPKLHIHEPDHQPWNDEDNHGGDLADLPLARPMFATSGTSGRPKIVHPIRFTETLAAAHALDEAELWQPTATSVQLVCSPLFHSAGFRSATATLLAGGTVELHQRFEAAAVRRALDDDAITGAFLVPTHLRRLVALDAPPLALRPRRLLHAGEPCPPALKEAACAILGELGEFYGSTEGQFTSIEPTEWRAHPGSVGLARPGRTLTIREPTTNGVGTIWCTAPSFARWSYWQDPDATAAAWDDDAFTVGDLGHLDGDGYLWIDARREDLIISGGVNCYPAAIESALLEHALVSEAAVIGLPDEEWGQRVVAVIVGSVTSDQLDGFLRERLPGPSRPKEIRWMTALPRNQTGKIDRDAVRRVAGETSPIDELG